MSETLEMDEVPEKKSPTVDWAAAIFLLMPSCGFASYYGNQIEGLEMPAYLVAFAQASPLLMAASFIVFPLLFGSFRIGWLGSLLGIMFLLSPPLILAGGSTWVQLDRTLTAEQVRELRTKFEFPVFIERGGTRGSGLRLSRSHMSPNVEATLKELGYRSESSPASGRDGAAAAH